MQCECGFGTFEKRQWGIHSQTVGFIRITEQAGACALVSHVL